MKVKSIKIANRISLASAHEFRAALLATTQEPYWRPEVTVCPAGGSFDVMVSTRDTFESEFEFLEAVIFWLADRKPAPTKQVTITDAERKALLGDD